MSDGETEFDRLKAQKDEILRRQRDIILEAVRQYEYSTPRHLRDSQVLADRIADALSLPSATLTPTDDARRVIGQLAAYAADEKHRKFNGHTDWISLDLCDLEVLIAMVRCADGSHAPIPPGKERDPNYWPNGVWKCGALNCEPPCRCSPPVPLNHKPIA